LEFKNLATINGSYAKGREQSLRVTNGVEMSEEGWQVDNYRFADGTVPIRN
jgi:hypothetical protein